MLLLNVSGQSGRGAVRARRGRGGEVGQQPRREDASAAAGVNEVVGGWSPGPGGGPRSPRGGAGHCVCVPHYSEVR